MVRDVIAGRRPASHVAIALGYAAALCALRMFYFSHWIIFAGLRMLVLLFVPRRYWPALVVGEALVLGASALGRVHDFGWLWAALFVIPPIAVAMPLMRWAQKHRRLLRPGVAIAEQLPALITCAVALSVLWSGVNLVTMAATRLPEGYHITSWPALAGRYFLGNFLGILTLVPIALALRDACANVPYRQWVGRFLRSSLCADMVVLLLPVQTFLIWLVVGAAGAQAAYAARLAMFVPVVWLALRQGWRGAAVGGTAASLAVALTMPADYDVVGMQAQAFIAFAMMTMLLLGGGMSALRHREARERARASEAVVLAHASVQQTESRLHRVADAVEELWETLQFHADAPALAVGAGVSLQPRSSPAQFIDEVKSSLIQLADGLRPVRADGPGLRHALCSGPLARALNDGGLRYWCTLVRPTDALSAEAGSLVYRLTCEAAVLLCTDPSVGSLHVRIRVGQGPQGRWTLICLDADTAERRDPKVQWREVMFRVAASGGDLAGLRRRVSLFGGQVRTRSRVAGERLSLLVRDPADGRLN